MFTWLLKYLAGAKSPTPPAIQGLLDHGWICRRAVAAINGEICNVLVMKHCKLIRVLPVTRQATPWSRSLS